MYRLKKNGRAAVILPDGFLFGLDNAKLNLKKKLLKHYTGWNCLIVVTIFPKVCINHYTVTVRNYWHYLLPQ